MPGSPLLCSPLLLCRPLPVRSRPSCRSDGRYFNDPASSYVKKVNDLNRRASRLLAAVTDQEYRASLQGQGQR